MPERQTDAASARLIKETERETDAALIRSCRFQKAQKKEAENREENQRDKRKMNFLFNIKANVSPEPL